MSKFRPTVKAALRTLGAMALETLRSKNLLEPLARRELTEQATASLSLPDELTEKALINHCQQLGIKNEKELKTWLDDRCLLREELLN